MPFTKPTHTQLSSLLLLAALTACTTAAPAAATATPGKTAIPTATRTPAPTQTPPPTLSPTPDIWTMQACKKTASVANDHIMIWTYNGDIEGHGDADMILSFTRENEIQGFLFDFGQHQEYRVDGCVADRDIILWLQQENQVTAIIQGEFPAKDPRGHYKSDNLTFELITGRFSKKGSPEEKAIYVRMYMGNGGNMQHRFKLEFVEDDTIILNASKTLIDAVAQDDRPRVVKMLHFPIEVNLQREYKVFKTPESFLSYYDAIFGGGFKERLAAAFPNNLLAYSGKIGGIGLSIYGGGSIAFNMHGQVTGIYNWQSPTPTPTP